MLLPNDNMEQITQLKRIINGCIAMEYSVASMYSAFMHLFPKYSKFWKDLLYDEMEHASQLKNYPYVKGMELFPTMDPLPSVELIENSIENTDNQIRQIRAISVSLKDALKIAMRLEETLLEIYSDEFMEHILAIEHEPLNKKLVSFEMSHMNKIVDMMTIKDSRNLS
jgi:rubrerythrin